MKIKELKKILEKYNENYNVEIYIGNIFAEPILKIMDCENNIIIFPKHVNIQTLKKVKK